MKNSKKNTKFVFVLITYVKIFLKNVLEYKKKLLNDFRSPTATFTRVMKETVAKTLTYKHKYPDCARNPSTGIC